jgi:vancomycin resistance protein VanJ
MGVRILTIRKHSILARTVTLYVILITIWLLLRVLFFDQLWPLALLNTIAEYLFVPLSLLLIIAIWQRHWSSLLKLTIPTIAFVLFFGELFIPPLSATPTQDNQQTIAAMSFNILHSNRAYKAIAGTIQAASPDLVALQELTPTSAQEIINALEAEYPYHTLEAKNDLSVGLLSRFPIKTVDQFPLPPLDLALHAIVNINGEHVHIFVVHLSPNNFLQYPRSQFVSLVIERYGRRATEVARLETEISDLNEPVLLMCDCNLTDTSEAYTHLDTFLIDSFREAGWGLGHTFYPPTAPFPLQRIDYVWHSDDFVAIEAFVGEDGNSDHLPIVAKLRLVKTL